MIKKIVKFLLRRAGFADTIYLQIKYHDPFVAQRRLLKGKSPVFIFDIGGYDGRTAIKYDRLFSRTHIHIFEPFPASVKRIRKSYGDRKNFIINEVAISNFVGKDFLHINNNAATNSLLPSNASLKVFDKVTTTIDRIEVQVNTIDNYCDEIGIEYIDILKLDVQGGELRVLEGAEGMLRRKRISVIYCELEFVEIYEGQPLVHHISQFLNGFGYSLYSLYNFSYLPDGRMSYCDGIFVFDK